MLALAEILALVILNALIHTAFTRWKKTRRTSRAHGRSTQPAKLRIVTHYPLHPSPVFNAAPEHAAHVRPAGIDW
jgi:hypothetical protein